MGRFSASVNRHRWSAPALAVAVVSGLLTSGPMPGVMPAGSVRGASTPTTGPVANFTAAINRLVELVGFAGGGILALVWARVALSWFSNDVTK